MKFSLFSGPAAALTAFLLSSLPPLKAGTLTDKAPVPVPEKAAADSPKSAGLLNEALREKSSGWDEWDIGGQVRFRYEVKDDAGSFPNRDFIRGLDNDNDYFLFRQKLHLGWQPEKWLKFYAEGRGAQVTSDDREPSPEKDIWDLHQAYIELGNRESLPLTLTAGRQEMTYGDQRFIGLGDWSNTPRSFDAVRLRHRPGKQNWIDLFSSRLVIPRDDYFNESNEHDQFSGIYAGSKELVTGLDTQAFFLARNTGAGSPDAIAPGIGGPSERDVYTYGMLLKSLPGAFGGWDFTFEGAGQFGSVVSGGERRDLRSFALTGSTGWTFEDVKFKPRLGVGYDYASGDSDPADGKQETFEPLFGTNHSFYGVADLIGLRNISSPRVSLSAKPLKGLSVAAEWLLFWLADTNDFFYPESGSGRSANGYGRNPEFDSFVGSELDLTAKYAFSPWGEVQLGYAHFFASDYIEQSAGQVPQNGGAADADWAYVQMTVNF